MLTCELTKTLLATQLHVIMGIQGIATTANNCDSAAGQNMWDQDHFEPKISSGLESVEIPLSPTCCLFLCTVHHHKLNLCSLAEKELNLQVKADHILHCASKILLQQLR